MQICVRKLFFIFFLNFTQVIAYFTIVGSRTFIFGGSYKLFVTSTVGLKDPQPELKLLLIGHALGEEFEQDVKLTTAETLVTFDLTQHRRFENFTLCAFSEKLGYNQNVSIITVNKDHSELIQTDKAIYKPGDKIQFRVIVLNGEALPYQYVRTFCVNISDSHGNFVYESDNEEIRELYPGVYAGDYTISDSPPLGQWRISVQVDDGLQSFRTFEVAEYVLPRFSAHIETTSDVLLKTNKIKVNVFGEYTFGEYVSSLAVVTAKVFEKDKPDIIKIKKVKSANVSAKKLIEFDLSKDLNMKTGGTVKIELEIEEKSTGKKMNETKTVTVHATEDHSIELIKSQNKFKPGFPFRLKAIVRRFDGSLETETRFRIKMNGISYLLRPKSAEMMSKTKTSFRNEEIPEQVKLLNDGVAEFDIDVPQDAARMTLVVKYLTFESSINVTRMNSKSREYLNVQLVEENPPVEGSFMIRVESTRELNSFYYAITGKKFKHNKISQARRKKVFELILKRTPDMSATSKVIVYYIHETGEVIYDSVDIKVEQQLRNSLKISAIKETSPGLESRITLRSNPGSFVGLLAVDKRVLLTKSSNDIDEKRVFEELSSYDPSNKYEPLTIAGWPSKYLDFGGSNTFILTDAEEDIIVDSRFGSNESDYEGFDYDYSESFPDWDRKDETSHAMDSDRVRKNFPETWLFENILVGENGEYELRKVVPDSITSYIVTGFSIDQEYGFGIAPAEKIYVKQNFFIKINLPYSIRFGEILKVEIQIFNYLPDRKPNLSVNVHMFRDPEDPQFEFIEKVAKCRFKAEANLDNKTKIVSVAQNSISTTYFFIRPLQAGKIKMNFKAQAQQVILVDSVEKEFLVEHDGFTHYVNSPVIVDLTKGDSYSYINSIRLNEIAIPKTMKVGATLIGDMMGEVLSSVHKLIKLPTGCAEQRLLTFMATAISTNYLKSINRLTNEFNIKSKNYLKTGYHQIIERKNSDGSFNLWGYEKSDSIWLSAYMLKCLGLVKYQTSVNDIHIYDSMRFLMAKQKPSGSFSEYGPISHKRVQGGLSSDIALTAYVVISFCEISEYREKYERSIQTALKYLDSNVIYMKDEYDKAIFTYAMVLGNHKDSNKFLDSLESTAIREEDKMFWSVQTQNEDSFDLPIQVETAGYALLAFLKSERYMIAAPIINWLISKRNVDGGFYSTQDTVIGLQALAEAAKIFYVPSVSMEVSIRNADVVLVKNVTQSNRFETQHFDFPPNTRNFAVNAEGKGKALLNIWYSYNTNINTSSREFDLDLKVLPSKNGGIFYLKTCSKRSSHYEGSDKGMVVIEITLPSGYVYDSDSTAELREFGIKKVETKNQKSHVVLYFNQITHKEICPEIRAIREHMIDDLKNSPVIIYDYYNDENRAIGYYSATGAQSCQ